MSSSNLPVSSSSSLDAAGVIPSLRFPDLGAFKFAGFDTAGSDDGLDMLPDQIDMATFGQMLPNLQSPCNSQSTNTGGKLFVDGFGGLATPDGGILYDCATNLPFGGTVTPLSGGCAAEVPVCEPADERALLSQAVPATQAGVMASQAFTLQQQATNYSIPYCAGKMKS